MSRLGLRCRERVWECVVGCWRRRFRRSRLFCQARIYISIRDGLLTVMELTCRRGRGTRPTKRRIELFEKSISLTISRTLPHLSFFPPASQSDELTGTNSLHSNRQYPNSNPNIPQRRSQPNSLPPTPSLNPLRRLLLGITSNRYANNHHRARQNGESSKLTAADPVDCRPLTEIDPPGEVAEDVGDVGHATVPGVGDVLLRRRRSIQN